MTSRKSCGYTKPHYYFVRGRRGQMAKKGPERRPAWPHIDSPGLTPSFAATAHYGIMERISEDFDHGRSYGTVCVRNPFFLTHPE